MRWRSSLEAAMAAALASALQLGCSATTEGTDTEMQGPEDPDQIGGPLTLGDQTRQALGWSDWVNIPIEILSDPTACTQGATGGVWLIVRRPNNALWQTYFHSAISWWRQFETLGGTLLGSPAVVCQRGGVGFRHDVYAQGGGRELYHRYQIPFFTSDWENLNGSLSLGTGPAAAVLPALRRQDLLVHWQDGSLRHKWFQGSWTTWSGPIVTGLRGDPAAVYTASNRMDVFANFIDGRLRHTFVLNGRWQPWVTLPGVFSSSPEVISTATGVMYLFGRASDNTLIYKRYANGVWGPWESLGGYLTSGPGATFANGRIMVFVRGYNGTIFYRVSAPILQ